MASIRFLLRAAGFEVLGIHALYFSLSYVLRRLSHHGWPVVSPALVDRTPLGDLAIPLLMGEVTVIARRV
ncbi:MAG: hypothetical protein HRU17_15610 [Polyangiaceae bacterium]|nr:hypothetical protein [Polyangiaceae bacterium]